MTMRFWVGEIETRNFDFIAFGRTEEVKEVLRGAWRRHCEEYSDATITFDELLDGGSVTTYEARTGMCLRDHQEV